MSHTSKKYWVVGFCVSFAAYLVLFAWALSVAPSPFETWLLIATVVALMVASVCAAMFMPMD